MWRLPVRCDDLYKKYVNDLFRATYLDRNQIIRAMMFSAPFTDEFQALMKKHSKTDTTPPLPQWGRTEHGLWLEQTLTKEGREGRHDDTRTRKQTGSIAESRQLAGRKINAIQNTTPRSSRKVHEQNGVQIRLG